MICGALQTLNEEACEDVLDEIDEIVPEVIDNDVPITFVVPPSPESQQGDLKVNKNSFSEPNVTTATTKEIFCYNNYANNSTNSYDTEISSVIVHMPPPPPSSTTAKIEDNDKPSDVTVSIYSDNNEESHF